MRGLVHAAAVNLARFDTRLPGQDWNLAERARLLIALCRFDLVALAGPDAADRLLAEYTSVDRLTL